MAGPGPRALPPGEPGPLTAPGPRGTQRPSAVLHRLLEWGIVERAAVAGGDVELTRLPGRHGALLVEVSGGPQLVVKVPSDAVARAQIAREAAICRALAADATRSALCPAVVRHDPASGVLVTARVAADARGADALLRPATARWLGRSLALLHGGPPPPPADAGAPPWLATIDAPPVALLCDLAPSAIDVVRVVQGDAALAAGVAAARDAGLALALCHMDLRTDNLVLGPEGAEGASRIVDWESARRGDPAWDLGWALAAYLSAWLDSVPADDPGAASEIAPRAERPLSVVRPLAAMTWGAYRAGREPPGVAAVTRCAAVRLLAAAMERHDAAGGPTASGRLHLQVAARMMERPEGAARDLMGIP